MKLLGATASHVGNVREANQDRVFFRGMVAALADGMGGHQGGERAAELAIGEFTDAASQLSEGELVEVVLAANRQVHGHAADNGLPGMGTTLVALTLHGDETITIANVGDSRAYWLRGDYMGQVTEDHSFVEDLVRQGRLTPDEAAIHPQRNILTRAVGIGAEVEVDRFPIPAPQIGDRFLLCSDGLFNELSEEHILQILLEAGDPVDTANALIEATLETPCRDNVTVAVVDLVEDDDARLLDQTEDRDTPADGVTTAPVPVVSKSVLHEPGPEPTGSGGGGGGGGAETNGASSRAGTLLLAETDTDVEDPELYLDTAELQIVDEEPMTVQPRSKLVLGLGAVVLALGLAVGGFFLARSYAQSGFFIAENQTSGELQILHGRRGGFLVFDPDVVAETGFPADQLNETDRALIAAETFSTQADAEELLTTLQQRELETAADAQSSQPSDSSQSNDEGSSAGSNTSGDG